MAKGEVVQAEKSFMGMPVSDRLLLALRQPQHHHLSIFNGTLPLRSHSKAPVP